MKPEKVKRILRETVQELNACKWLYSARPGKDNTRKRKFPFEKMISSILALRAGSCHCNQTGNVSCKHVGKV